jgi:pyruvate/2-oxoglutarate dehydrogenase complex dihydrolipoamide dehydrogenase (E3) component
MPSPTQFDAIIIGTGQAGPTLATRLAAEGQRVAILERHRFGGTCVNTGCIPTKALVASARAAWVARRAADWGVRVQGDVSVDMKQVKARKDAIVRASNEGIEKWLRQTPNVTVIMGHARFVGPHRVAVGEQVVEAERIFINVGARPHRPDTAGLADVPYLTSSSMMKVDFLPAHLIILGGGYIALEFAQMYRRFGSQVTIIERGPRLLSREDDDVCAAIRAILEAEDITVRTASQALRVERRGEGVVVEVRRPDGGSDEIAGSHLLVAVGRVPNTADLGLETTGVAVDRHGFIEVDDTLATRVPGIFALGDCNGHGAFTHTSYNDQDIVADNLLRGDSRRLTDRIPTYALFIDPPLGRCGANERQVRAAGRPALMATLPMSRVGRARERGETQGFMKILVDAQSKLILGAALLGIDGDEVVHVVMDVMYAGAPYTVIQRAMHIHPTVAEFLPTLLEGLKPLA